MTAWTDKFMAIPFVDGGRSRAGADCFGLYAIVVRDLFAVQLDQDVSYERDADAVVRRVADEVASDRWITIATGDGAVARAAARKGDAIVMSGHVHLADGRVVRGDIHLGVALGDGRVLHTEPTTGPQILALDDPRIVRRVRGVWRPRALAEASP